MKTLLRTFTISLWAAVTASAGVVLTPTQDTDVYQFTTVPTSTIYSLGVSASPSSAPGHSQKSLIQFNPTTTTLGMAASEIASAKLRLYILTDVETGSGYGGTLVPGSVTVNPQTVTWSVGTAKAPGARWSTFTPGAAVGTIPIVTNGVWVELDMTALVKAWVAGTTPNYGIMIQPTTDPAANPMSVLFASMETDPETRPQLVVEKIVPLPFAVTKCTMSGSNVTLNWNSVVGKTYTVRESPDLVNWTTRQTVTATGVTSTTTFTRTTYPGGKGFFRVQTPQ